MAIRVDGEVNKEMDKSPRTTGQPQDAWAGIAHENQSSHRPTEATITPGAFPRADHLLPAAATPPAEFLKQVSVYNQNEAALHEYDPATKQKITNLNIKAGSGQPLTPSEKYELQAVKTFPHDGYAAFLDARKLAGDQLDAADNRALNEALHFHTNYYGRLLEDRETLGTINPSERQVLSYFRSIPDDHEDDQSNGDGSVMA